MKNNLLQKTWFRYILNTLTVIVIFILMMGLINSGTLNMYYALLLIPIGYNIILAVSLNITAGFLGQLPLGHAGFMAVGAYASALFSLSVDLPAIPEFIIALLIGGFVSACFGIVIGLPALRLRGDYLAIITLGFGEIIRVIILNLKFTGGAYGLRGIEKHTTIPGVFICVVITLFVLTCFIRSRHGRAILAIREDEIAAEASGIPTTYYKVAAFTVSAFFAGVAGGLYAHYLSILDASTFGFMKSVEILVMVVLGGLGSMIGSVVSAIVLTLLPEMLRGFAEYRMVIYSLLLVIVMIFKPTGLFGKYDFSLSNTLDKLFIRIKKAVYKSNAVSGGEEDGTCS